MGRVSWFKGKRKIPPGTTETKIRYGKAWDNILWPKKGKLYTRPGELHIPIVVKTKDEKFRVADCVIRYKITNPSALLSYLEDGELKTEDLERKLAYECRAKLSFKLSNYTYEELPKKSLETKAFIQKELSNTLNYFGMVVQDIFTVWEEPEFFGVWNDTVEKFYKEKIEPLIIKKHKKNNKKHFKAKLNKRKIEPSIEKYFKDKLDESEIKKIAHKLAKDYVRSNPRYSNLGEATFWENTLEQVFYEAIKEGCYGSD